MLTAAGKKKERALMTRRNNALNKAKSGYNKAIAKHSMQTKKIEDKYYSDLQKVYKKHSKKIKNKKKK